MKMYHKLMKYMFHNAFKTKDILMYAKQLLIEAQPKACNEHN